MLPSTEEPFDFGRNWQKFARLIGPERIAKAAESVRNLLGAGELRGRTFLDIGCGSGLFSLAAHRLGATVYSFDADPQSVACTRHVRLTYSSGSGWEVEQGSVLDDVYMQTLGRFDFVYSWGVLHHTGAMWNGLEAAGRRVAPGGLLAIAIYNDQGSRSDFWRRYKRWYMASPAPIRLLLASAVFARAAHRYFLDDLAEHRSPAARYRRGEGRGMSVWHDAVDWAGGYPFEVACPSAVYAFYEERGFHLRNEILRVPHSGCNEFVFALEGAAHSRSVAGAGPS